MCPINGRSWTALGRTLPMPMQRVLPTLPLMRLQFRPMQS
nr:MAG TPA: hypothetical protein [Caudoviricetes sp.]